MTEYLDCVAVGDLHFEGMAGMFPTMDHLGFNFQMLNQVVAYCNENNIDKMVQLGDIADTPFPSQKTIKRFTRWNAENPDIDKLYYPGNHDVASTEDNSLELFKDILDLADLGKHTRVSMHPEEIRWNGVPIQTIPYPYTKPPKASYPRLCLIHYAVSGSKGDNGYTVPEGVELNAGKDFYVGGHLHRYQHYLKQRLLYPGTLYQRTFGEPLPKGFCHLKIRWTKSEMRVKHDFIPIQPPFVLFNVKASDIEEAEKMMKAHRKTLADKQIVRFKLLLPKGMSLPKSFLQDNPDIHRHLRFKTEEEAAALEQDKLNISATQALKEMNVMALLRDRMKINGVDKTLRLRSQAILRDVATRNGIQLLQ